MGRHVVVLESRPCGLGLVMVKCSTTLLYEGWFWICERAGEFNLKKGFPPRGAGEFNLKKVWQRVLRNGAYDEWKSRTRACTILLCL